MGEATEVLPREVVQHSIVETCTYAALRVEFNACIECNDLRGARALVRHVVCLSTQVCRWFPSIPLEEFHEAYDRSFHMAAFDRAFDEFTDESGVRLGSMQLAYLRSVRAAVFRLPLGSPGTLLIRYTDHYGLSYVQALIAVLIAVSQPRGTTIYCSPTKRRNIQWLEKVQAFLGLLKVTVTSACPDYIKIQRLEGPEPNSIATVSLGTGRPANIRGLGDCAAVCFVVQPEIVHADAFPAVLPLFANAISCVMTSERPIAEEARKCISALFDSLTDDDNKRPIYEIDMLT